MFKAIIGILVVGLFSGGCGKSLNMKKMWPYSKKKCKKKSAVCKRKNNPTAELSSILEIMNQKAQMNDEGDIHVTAKVFNKSKSSVHVGIQTIFKNEEKNTVDRTDFQKVTIPGSSFFHYVGETKHEDARSFEIAIRRQSEA